MVVHISVIQAGFLFVCFKHIEKKSVAGAFARSRIKSLLCASCVSADMDGIGNTMQKKAAELERLAEVLITGEQLRWVLPSPVGTWQHCRTREKTGSSADAGA